jgi:RNA polymerase sigma-70 factor (ECF subfamily)
MRDLKALNDTELVQSAQQGDMNAFEELVYRHDKEVFSIAARYVNSAEDAKDIYQEVFLRAYRGLSKFRFQSEFRTWLYRIATNVCLTHQDRRKKNFPLLHDYDTEGDDIELRTLSVVSDPSHGSDQHTLNSEISQRVQDAMNELSPQQKLVFTLRHFQGYKLKEIAGMINCSEGAVKKYLFTATQRMRRQLKDLYD